MTYSPSQLDRAFVSGEEILWVVPRTPKPSPRSYGEASWVWTSPLHIQTPPSLVPMPPRDFQTLISSDLSTTSPLTMNISSPAVPLPSPERTTDSPRHPPPLQRISGLRLRNLPLDRPTQETYDFLRENLIQAFRKHRTAAELGRVLMMNRVQCIRKLKVTYQQYVNLQKTYNEIRALGNQMAAEIGPLSEDPKLLILQIQKENGNLQNKRKFLEEKLQTLKDDIQFCHNIVGQMDREFEARVAPIRQRYKIALELTFTTKLALHDEWDYKEQLRNEILDEKTKAGLYLNQAKRERAGYRTLRQSVNNLVYKLNRIRQSSRIPSSPVSAEYSDLESLFQDISGLSSELMEEMQIHKQLTAQASRVPPTHIMNILKRYVRAKSHRKALTWQKKFLLQALRNCENAKEYKRYTFVKRRFNASGLWRVGAYVIIAITRTQFLVRNRSRNHRQAVNALQEVCVVSGV